MLNALFVHITVVFGQRVTIMFWTKKACKGTFKYDLIPRGGEGVCLANVFFNRDEEGKSVRKGGV